MHPQPKVSLVYTVRTGNLYVEDHDFCRALIGRGYCGWGQDRDNPNSERLVGKGPLPRGEWVIGQASHHARLGPVTFALTPTEKTETFGRSGFYIHGDTASRNFSASTGCIILDRPQREAIRALGIKYLQAE